MTKEFEDFESFLKNVDEISDLVKDLSSSDVTSQQRAVEKADCYISTLKEKEEPCKTLLNRTVINTNPSQQAPAPTGSQNDPSSSADHFMKMMESDAEDRHKRRQRRQEKANALKEKGNEAYAQGEYETAVKLYSDGLDERRDMQPLYTNRAQSYIKLEKYKEAISDCEWALKCNDKCVKAYLHMGKAHLALKNYNESRMCYQKILEIEPGREKMLKEYLTQVDLEEERECQESNAWEEFDKGEEKATTVLQLLKKLQRPDQFPLYYCAGLKLLSHAITDCTGQTLFRLNNGFSIIQTNDTVRRFCLQLRDTFTTLIVPPFASLLKNITTFNQHSFPSLISTIGNMIGDDAIHNEVANCQEFWQASLIAMKWCTHCEYREILYPLLGLMINLSGNPSTAIQEHAVPISGVCLGLLSDPDGGIITRATGLLSKVLPQSPAATEDAVQRGIVRTIRRLLKGSGKTTTKYLIKTLTVCTAISQTAQEEWVKCDNRLHTLRRLLGPSSEEAVAGNAALCLGHCLGVRGAASSLLGTDTVLLLLRLAAGDAKRSAVQQNSAIALGKLCKAEPRHMAKLRELHGLEILHSCMKLIT
uniref:tetratricopeptide repeat protein 12 isoform X2 n=1 Tax=Oncorhynchus gorbuscha TaxID=8017 RepID=UPI001EAED09D|nr:tetratricopeptide repeat protein 12 isoform X2 [Oncorhynchus gorbuscha]